jgi:hypothetical protein
MIDYLELLIPAFFILSLGITGCILLLNGIIEPISGFVFTLGFLLLSFILFTMLDWGYIIATIKYRKYRKQQGYKK